MDIEALVMRVEKLKFHDWDALFTKNDPDMYHGIRETVKKLRLSKMDNVKGHQDQEGRELNLIERMNILVDKFSTKSIKECQTFDTKWSNETGLILKTVRRPIACKEDLNLIIEVKQGK